MAPQAPKVHKNYSGKGIQQFSAPKGHTNKAQGQEQRDATLGTGNQDNQAPKVHKNFSGKGIQ